MHFILNLNSQNIEPDNKTKDKHFLILWLW